MKSGVCLAVGLRAAEQNKEKEKKETEVPAREEPDIVVSIVAVIVVVHVRAVLIRIAEKDATTSVRIIDPTLQDSPQIDPVHRSHG
jgi:hypothetical protein